MIVVRCLFLGLLILTMTNCASEVPPAGDYPFRPVPFTDVEISDTFWQPRLETNRTVTIPYAFGQCEETGRIDNFRIAAGIKEGDFCTRYTFDDSDVYKIIEGASYTLHIQYDAELDAFLDDLIEKIAAAQEDDGYLYTARTIKSDKPVMWVDGDRWSNLYLGHELYNVGHFYEAAVAHHLATGKRTMLDIAIRNADLIASVFGPGKKLAVPGHQEIEVGLVKLYRVTGDRKYFDLAKFFLDQRGHANDRELFGEYSQDHKPVLEQSEAVGHSVRAVYMFSGMADIAAITGDDAYTNAIRRIWNDVVSGKTYLTGGIGATGEWEGFGEPYQLPNATAYAETCASIGNVFWNHRMFLLEGDGKYYDVLERVLYNGLISGSGLSGDLFFYPNPLESYGQHQRDPWFTCACCPSNLSRFVPSLPGYLYATRGDAIFVNLFVDSSAEIKMGGQNVRVKQETRYPWEGSVEIEVEPEIPASFAVHVRVPGWARNEPFPSDLYRYLDESDEKVSVEVNGEPWPLELEKGYIRVSRDWQSGDTINLELPMPVRRVVSHTSVAANDGKVALQRGPLVYSVEWPDHQGHVSNLVLPDEAELEVEHRDDFFDGVAVIKGQAVALHAAPPSKRDIELTAIPYYAWAYRGRGEMAVWLPREEEGVRPLPEPSVASQSKATASGGDMLVGLNDQWDPPDSGDRSRPYLHWWPEIGTAEWVQYELSKPTEVSKVGVYWYDDGDRGRCRVPESWKVLYRQGNEWKPVVMKGTYGTDKDAYNWVAFEPVRSTALRLEIQSQNEFSIGVLEWKIE